MSVKTWYIGKQEVKPQSRLRRWEVRPKVCLREGEGKWVLPGAGEKIGVE